MVPFITSILRHLYEPLHKTIQSQTLIITRFYELFVVQRKKFRRFVDIFPPGWVELRCYIFNDKIIYACAPILKTNRMHQANGDHLIKCCMSLKCFIKVLVVSESFFSSSATHHRTWSSFAKLFCLLWSSRRSRVVRLQTGEMSKLSAS